MADGSSVVQAVRVGDPIGVGAADRYGIVEGRPTLLRLAEGVQRALIPAAAGLVDATASGVDRADVGAIEIQRADGAFRLVRDFEGWRAEMIGEDGEPTDVIDAPRGAVEQLLEQLTVARAGALELGYPRALEVAVVILFDYDDRPIDTVRIAREPNAGALGARERRRRPARPSPELRSGARSGRVRTAMSVWSGGPGHASPSFGWVWIVDEFRRQR